MLGSRELEPPDRVRQPASGLHYAAWLLRRLLACEQAQKRPAAVATGQAVWAAPLGATRPDGDYM
jgi:hypothetical protein